MQRIGDIKKGAPGGRSTADLERREKKWRDVLDHTVREKLSREDILRAYSVLSVIQTAYSVGNEPKLAAKLSEANKLLAFVCKGLTDRFGAR